MTPLPTNLRRDLERAIVAARTAAELGARSALGALTVPDARVGSHLDTAGRALRNRLRAHARQLGDKRSAKGEQAIDRLVRECAYEHWHRMLFARFLAENDLLIEPVSGVPVSLDEVDELARDQNMNRWELASRYAQRMLPGIFHTGDPVLAIDLPTETRLKLESLLESLPPAVFTAADSLGWVYQFWQSAEKDAVNARVKSGEKITGATLPAVTQLFTEHYMVLFLLHNTVGAWWAGKKLTTEDTENAETEEELRKRVALPGVDWEYLRFVRDGTEKEQEPSTPSSVPSEPSVVNPSSGPWRPAAGVFEGWPRAAKEITILDPCCGSGHFIVAAFSLLVHLRMEEEFLTLEGAIAATIADNLFGLELDARCTQIAAFNLALAAWKLAGKPIELPPMRIACSGLGPQATKEEWLKLADSASAAWKDIPAHAHEFIRNGLLDLHETFSKAPELGSLIDPADRSGDLITADYETLTPFLDAVFKAETNDDEQRERAVAAKGMADAAEILIGPNDGYTLVVTNVPYLLAGKMNPALKVHVETTWPAAKNDLAFVMLLRLLDIVSERSTVALVLPNTFLFMSGYKALRKRLLKTYTIESLARLGPRAFPTISGEIVRVALLTISRNSPDKSHAFSEVLVEDQAEAAEKDEQLRLRGINLSHQLGQLQNPEARLVVGDLSSAERLGNYADSYIGLQTSDNPRFCVYLWEVGSATSTWSYLQTPTVIPLAYAGRDSLLRWDDGVGELQEVGQIKGTAAWGRRGIAIRLMSDLPPSLYNGAIFEQSSAAIIPKKAEYLPAIWCYCLSDEFRTSVRRIDQAIKITNKTFEKIDFNYADWSVASAEKYPNGLPEPQSDDPTQWLFHGRPERAEAHAVLQVGVARLLGYRWPAELDTDMRLAPEARALVNRCAELDDHADEDGIVCLSPVRTEAPAADRLRRLLAAAFGDEWSNNKERELLRAAADEFNKGAVAGSLDDWLRERFFVEHCKLFHNRPFIWHIWDGKKDGFHALVNYHKLAGPEGEARRTLESLTYSYLGDWIQRQQAAVKSGEAGAEARLAAAMELKGELEKILAGEPPYDLFVRWKPLHEQAIEWAPDINDGVRLNIRPFLKAADVKKKGAGVLRAKPNIKWTKDRGKEPQSLRPREDFPWFWGWDEKTPDFAGGAEFDGARWNDLHYSNKAKQAARERAAAEVAT